MVGARGGLSRRTAMRFSGVFGFAACSASQFLNDSVNMLLSSVAV